MVNPSQSANLMPNPADIALIGGTPPLQPEIDAFYGSYTNGIKAAAYLLGAELAEQDYEKAALRAENARLHYEATHDSLTGLLNRRGVMEVMQNLVDEEPGNFALIYFDLDDLKKANTEGGHSAGDRLLINTASTIIGSSLRTRGDKKHGDRPHDVQGSDVARLGGDEFLAILRGVNTAEVFEIVGNRIIDRLEAAGVRASSGGAIHQPGQTAEEFIDLSEQAMTQDKSERRPEMQERQKAALPVEKLAAHEELRAKAQELGIDLVEHWQLYGPTSR
jgi:diguanylate cyclase (GGDEF)-like protein